MSNYRYSDAFWLRKTFQLIMILFLWLLLLRLIGYEENVEQDLGSSNVTVAVVQNTDTSPPTEGLRGLKVISSNEDVTSYAVGDSVIEQHAQRVAESDSLLTWEYRSTETGLQMSLQPTEICDLNGAKCTAPAGDVVIVVQNRDPSLVDPQFVIRHSAPRGEAFSDSDAQLYKEALESYSNNKEGAL